MAPPLSKRRHPGTEAAIRAAGGPHALAKLIGVHPNTVIRDWADGVPYERILEVEAATGVPRETLRPELYRHEEAETSTAAD